LKVAFTKAHGCGNDFLLVPGRPSDYGDPAALAVAICDRHRGVGADGLYFVIAPAAGADAEVHLYNSDGSAAELSGNGTRCVAAWLLAAGVASNPLRILTGAGLRELRPAGSKSFEMAIGVPRVSVTGHGFTDVDLGNPQCINFVEHFDFDWKARGFELERHPHYPHKTNVEFVRVRGQHHIEIRIWERGAGWTLSSGTGAAASAVAAVHAGLCAPPVTVETEGGNLEVRWEGDSVFLTGPAEITARGEFYC
jgi:diaminopimelate epimerase